MAATATATATAPAHGPLFTWSLRGGGAGAGDALPTDAATLAAMVELTLHRPGARARAAGLRERGSFPAHEAAMRALPPTLRILRADGCHLRTFPQPFPPALEEAYLATNHYLGIPDLSAAAALEVLEMPDNDVADVANPLPPALVRLNLYQNALHAWTTTAPPPATLTNVDLAMNGGFVLPPAWAQFAPWRAPVRAPAHHTAHHAMFGGGAAVAPAAPAPPVNVYKNNHNVHDSGVQASTRASVAYLVGYRPDHPENPRLWEDMADAYVAVAGTGTGAGCLSRWAARAARHLDGGPVAEVRRYVEKSNSYSMHGVTLGRLVDRVWLRIADTADAERRAELMRRFREETEEGVKHCSNGFVVRLTNVFVGFDDNVQMKLQPRQVLQSRIPATMDRLRKERAVQPGYEDGAFWAAVYKATVADMEDLGVGAPAQPEAPWDVSQWREWLEPLAEPVLDDVWEAHPELHAPRRPDGEAWETSDYAPALTAAGLRGFEWEAAALRDRARA